MASTPQDVRKGEKERTAPVVRKFRLHPLLVMLAVFVAGLGLAWMLQGPGFIRGPGKWELTKLAMQVSVVGVAGALFSYVADDYRRQQERRRLREDFLKDTLKRITASYNKSKGARRIVRARGLIPASKPTHVRIEAYDKCMAELNEAQLEFEAVERDLLTSSKRFHSDEWGRKFAEAMEKHLGHVIEEYEVIRRRPDDGETKLALVDLEEFRAFVDPVDKSVFKKFSYPHGRARDAMNKELLLLNSGRNIETVSEEMRQELDADEKMLEWERQWKLDDDSAKARKRKRKSNAERDR